MGGGLTGVVYPDEPVAEVAGICRVCRGPCLFYAGDTHRWTCRACLDAYLAEQCARADELRVRERAAHLAAGRAGGGSAPAGGDGSRRGGGGLVVERTAVPGAARQPSTCDNRVITKSEGTRR
jgi:hypothetical protein